jgi:uncharacterized protein (DUF1800 family)
MLAAQLGGCDRLESLLTEQPLSLVGDSKPSHAPEKEEIDLLSHLLNRLTYGPTPFSRGEAMRLAEDRDKRIEAFVERQLHPGEIEDIACERSVRRLETLRLPVGELFEYKADYLLEELTRSTVLRATYSNRQLQEVMVEFWTDHFNIDSSKGDCRWLKTWDDREVIRRHGLGNFRDLLEASAMSPAMLWYLDGRANRVSSPEDKPNENYARELLELHTLGVDGGYTQRDVMEVARCLSGWTVRSDEWFGQGEIRFVSEWHDNTEKEVLGQRISAGGGPGDLNRVLDLVASHPSTARHIATKLCRKFISDAPPAGAVDRVAKVFRDTQGEIASCLRTLFASQEFLDARGAKFKRPFRFLVSSLRAVGAESEGSPGLYDYLLRMGHAPFQYPTPDGYPEESSPWMGTLLWRWKFAVALCENRVSGVRVNFDRVPELFPSQEEFAAHVLGVWARPEHLPQSLTASQQAALWLASPTFQRC